MIGRFVVAFLLFMAAALQAPCSARAEGTAPESSAYDGWEFSFTPYAWVLFITGDQTAGTDTSSIDTNLFEIIEEAKELYAFNSEQELRKGKLGILADVVWANVRVPVNEAVTGEIPGIPRINVAIGAEGGAAVKIAVVEPGVAYEIFDGSSGSSFKDPVSSERSTAIDLLGGARYWYLRTEIGLNVTATLSIPALGLSRTGAGRVDGATTTDWWDPYVGIRLRHKHGPGQEVVLRGDIGGFGVGSDFTWQLEGLYNYDTRLLGHDVTAQLGYRALYADYEEGSGDNTVGYDWLWHGPVVGLKFTF